MKTKPENSLPKIAPGAVCAQMVRCGKPNCKCARGQLHGPYFYHFVRVNGALVKRYVKGKDAAHLRAACQARREEESQRRLAHKQSSRELLKIVEKLRESEGLMLQFLEARNG